MDFKKNQERFKELFPLCDQNIEMVWKIAMFLFHVQYWVESEQEEISSFGGPYCNFGIGPMIEDNKIHRVFFVDLSGYHVYGQRPNELLYFDNSDGPIREFDLLYYLRKFYGDLPEYFGRLPGFIDMYGHSAFKEFCKEFCAEYESELV